MISFQQIGYMGRLGNQMFQFASTLGIANRLNTIARFPIENCLNYQESGPFDPKIGRCMPVKCDLTDCFDISPEYFIPQRHINQGNYYNENEFGYNPGVESISGDCSLNGYFQTEKYFNEFRDAILSQFTFKNPYKDSAEAYIQTIRNEHKDAVIASIHVRRGDYVMFPDHHPPCSFAYYNNAIKNLRIENENIIYVIFSDDVEWCKTEFIGQDYIISNLENPYTELCAMSLCDHNIIANSSFSWWGAWLNVNPDKIVIAPSNWFGPAMNKDVSDIYCSGWNLMNKKRNIYFCVYSNEKYEKPRKALIELAKKSKIFSGIFEYDREWLEKTVFYKDNIEILGDTKGSGDGWCLWKPYVILESLNKIKEGDVIFYMDSTDTFSPNLGNFLDDYFNNNNLLLSLLGLSPNKNYTKRDTFFYMDCDSKRYWDSLQLEAGIIGVKKNKKNMKIISEYLSFCRNPNIINNSDNVCGLENLQGYIDHRYDQSVLTNIKTKYRINPSIEIRKYVECNMWEALKYWDNNMEFKRKVDIMKEKCGDEYILWKENYLDHIIN